MTRQDKQEKFIKKAIRKFGDKYDYSKVKYIDALTKVTIICPKHGEFDVIPSYFLKSDGCLLCKNESKFIEQSKKIHSNKYDYSKVVYKGCSEKVCIICPEHGEFWQTPTTHLNGCGCQTCGRISTINKLYNNTELFIKKAKSIHGDKYDYTKTNYVDWKTNVIITCKKHGDFKINPSNHINHNAGCLQCHFESEVEKNKKEFITKINTIYPNNEYDYSEIEYINMQTPINIKCNKHGYFRLKPISHLNGHICPTCQDIVNNIKIEKETQKFIEDSIKAHGEKYVYNKSVYVNPTTPVIVTCKKHGDFKVKPDEHRNGKYECPSCKLERQNMYTFEVCETLARQCKTQIEFKILDKKAYKKSINEKWIEQFIWLKPFDNMLKTQTIYKYEFPDNVVYIGLTNNILRRDKEHRKINKKNKSTVCWYANQNNIDIPKMVVIEDNLTREESQKRECYWIDKYKNDGYIVLNKVKGGSLGGNVKYHEVTNDEILACAKLCRTAEDMRRKNRSLYNYMISRGLKDEYFPNSKSKYWSPKRNYSEEYLIRETSKYENKKELRKSDATLFHYLYVHKRLDEFFSF